MRGEIKYQKTQTIISTNLSKFGEEPDSFYLKALKKASQLIVTDSLFKNKMPVTWLPVLLW